MLAWYVVIQITFFSLFSSENVTRVSYFAHYRYFNNFVSLILFGSDEQFF